MRNRRLTRRLTAVLLSLALCLSLLPAAALAEETGTSVHAGAEALPEGTEAPSGEAEAPSEGTEAPSGEAEAPSGEAEAPAGEAEAPSEGTEAPSEGTEAPSEGTEAPAGEDGAEPGKAQQEDNERNTIPDSAAPRSGETWEKVEWDNIQDGGTYVIAMTKPDGKSWLLPNSAASQPLIADSLSVELAGDTAELTADTASYGWTFTQSGSGFKISNSAGSYLFSNDANNGVRIGATEGIWTLSTGTHLGMDTPTTRYLGIYNEQDWRAYNNTTGNTAGQQVSFWHLQGETVEPPAPETKVKTPAATPAGGSTVAPGAAVTLSCATSGASFQTSADGTSWTELTGNTFTIPDDASGTYAVKVKAVKDGLEDSEVLELSYTIVSADDVVTIAQARQGPAGTVYTVSGTVTFLDGKNVYIQDETAGIDLFFAAAPSSLSRGDTVTAFGAYKVFNGLTELDRAEILSSAAGTLPAPREITIAEINESVESQLVKITGAKVTAVSDSTVTIAQGEGEAASSTTIYRCPTVENLTEGDTITVTAVVGRYNAFQLRVNSAEDIVITDDVTPEPEPEEPSGLYKPADGDKAALFFPGGGQVLTGEASGTRLKGAAASEGGGSLFVESGGALVLTVSVTGAEGAEEYTFTAPDGRVLNTAASGGSLTLVPAAEAVCAKWALTETSARDGWLVRSTQAEYNGTKNQYIEFYGGNFTTYSLKDGGDQGIYTLLFFPEESIRTIDWTVDTDVEQAVAQWGGALKAYEDAPSVTAIQGDLLRTGDELDAGSVYQAIKSGAPSMPLSASTAPNYYMGATGMKAGDSLQFKTSSKGWGGMTLSFRLRLTNAAANSWQAQYSTNGTDFANLGDGSYTASYTKYVGGVPEAVTKEGKITGGLLQVEKDLGGQYASYTLSVPVGAENAEELSIRLVSGNEKISGTGDASGNVRVDTVKLTGSPVVSGGVTPYVAIEPDNLEEVGAGQTITLSGEGTVYYGWADNSTGAVAYAQGNSTTVPAVLPATLFAYASSPGKADSAVRKITYLPAGAAAVQMSPNGGGVYLGNGSVEVVLTTATAGASIYYSLSTWQKNEDGTDKYELYTPGTTKIELTDGFGTLTVSAYAVKEGFSDSAVTVRTFTQRASESYQMYFGQMHSHTSYSDGAGTAAEAFRSVKALDQETWNMDFVAVTDHSNSFDCAGTVGRLADTPTGTEWNEGKQLARDISDEKFVGIFGYEMTWSNGLGHMNTFNTPGYQARTQKDYSTYSTALQNYYEELKTVPTSISQFNHPGTTFGDFSDFAHYDEEIDRLITLIEVGNGEGAIGSSGYFPSYEYYTRALDKGWHVAPTNNQDNHKGGWGTANTGRDVVLADELSESAIYDALRNYRVYATEDLNLEIYYTFDGNIMGSILDGGSYGAGDKAVISVALNDPNQENATVEVIVNGGRSLMSRTAACSETVTFEVENPAAYSYYYIRVTQSDGDIAVTAPVWVGKVEAVGITSLKAENAITVAGKPQSFTLELYNNETAPLEVGSITFTDKETGRVLHTAGDVTRVPKLGTASTSFTTSFTGDGSVTVLATVRGTLRGVEKTYTQELELKVMPENVVSRILVDGSHYNDYVTGYYGGRMGNMTSIAAGLGVEVVVAREITPELLAGSQLLVVSAPARREGSDNAGAYTHSAFEDSFIAMVKDYVDAGGSVVVCGLADYQDKNALNAEGHAAAQLNRLLEAVGSTLRIHDDEAYDEVHNGGQQYRLYPETFNMDSKWCRGIVTPDSVAEGETYQTYSQYSGCTVDPGQGTWLVKGFDTTYSIDSDGDGLGGVEKGDACFLACEETASGGTVFAAGGVFLSDFEVAAELDNIWDLPYANRTIYENILGMVRSGMTITPIAQTRTAPLNKIFAIEGYVTSGTDNPNTTFFDSIYVQDETGGTDVFPYAAAGLAIGTKVRVLGYTDAYQGDRELQVINLEILDAPAKIYEPRTLTTAQAADYETYGGQLVKTSGKVSDIVMAGGRVSQFKLTDSSGTAATVFIDGYITNPQGVNNLHTWLKEGQTVSAVGLLYSHPEGESDVSVPVLRVRNCDEIVKLADEPENPGQPGSGEIDAAAPVEDGTASVEIDAGSVSGALENADTEKLIIRVTPAGEAAAVEVTLPAAAVEALNGKKAEIVTPAAAVTLDPKDIPSGTTLTVSKGEAQESAPNGTVAVSVSGGAKLEISAAVEEAHRNEAFVWVVPVTDSGYGAPVKTTVSEGRIQWTGNGSGVYTYMTQAQAEKAGLVSPVYTITFDANGGAVDGPGTGTTTDGKLTELPGAARAGYTFDGWFLEAAGGQRVTTDTVFSGDATVYAHWTRSGGSSGGSSGGGGSSPSITRPETPPSPADPEKTPPAGFQDVPAGFWAEEAIAWAAGKGVMQGYGGGAFRPDRQVTRQQLWMVLARLNGGSPADMTAAAAWAVENGVSDGTNGGGAMSRQQMVTMLYRYARLRGYQLDGGVSLDSFPDAASVAGYAKDAMSWAVGNGVVQGASDGRLNPEGAASRAHFAVFLQRFCALYGVA